MLRNLGIVKNYEINIIVHFKTILIININKFNIFSSFYLPNNKNNVILQ